MLRKCPQCGGLEIMKQKRQSEDGIIIKYQCLEINCWHQFEPIKPRKVEEWLVFSLKKAY